MKEVKIALLENPQAIENILNKLDFYKIKNNTYKHEITCCNSEKGSGASIHLKLDETLLTSDFKYGIKGDFISFLIQKRNLEYKEVIDLIKDELGIENFTYAKRESNSLFGGIYSKIKKPITKQSLKILDEKLLNPYKNKYNTKFIKDGISLNTQKKYQLGFDIESQRITIPWKDCEGNLVGIMGRYNGDCEDNYRWLPIIPFPKRDLLYGYSQNYMYLYGCDDLYVGESEKFVMQLDSMDIKTCLGIGRSEVSSSQIKKMIAFQPKRIIYCLDEGLPEDIIIKNVKATQQFIRYSNIKVMYVWDENNDIVPYNSKYSPTDLGKRVFERLISEKLKEVV